MEKHAHLPTWSISKKSCACSTATKAGTNPELPGAWPPDASKAQACRVLGANAGGTRMTHKAIDVRVVDARTSRILAATGIEGEASDFDLGGAQSGWTGSKTRGGSL